MSKEKRWIAAKIPVTVSDEIDDAVNSGRYLNRSDFLRNALRTELEREEEPQ